MPVDLRLFAREFAEYLHSQSEQQEKQCDMQKDDDNIYHTEKDLQHAENCSDTAG